MSRSNYGSGAQSFSRRRDGSFESRASSISFEENVRSAFDSSGRDMRTNGLACRFPLDPSLLPRVSMPSATLARLKANLEKLADDAVMGGTVSWLSNPTQAPQYAKQQWRPIVQKKECWLFRRKGVKGPDSTKIETLIRGTIDTSLDELMYGLMCVNTEDFRSHLAQLYQERFLDGAVVQVLEAPTHEDPFGSLMIKWKAYQSPLDSVFAIRDLLYIEYTKTFYNVLGENVLARVYHSLDPKECNVDERQFGFVRNNAMWIQLFRAAGDSVDVTMSGVMRFPNDKKTPSWLINRYPLSCYPLMVNLARCADAKFMTKHELITDKPWVPDNQRGKCYVCAKGLNFYRSRHHCRICGEIMCSPCTREVAIRTDRLPPAIRSSDIVSVEKFCLKCMTTGSKRRRESHAVMLEPGAVPIRRMQTGSYYEDGSSVRSGRSINYEDGTSVRSGRSVNYKQEDGSSIRSGKNFGPNSSISSKLSSRDPANSIASSIASSVASRTNVRAPESETSTSLSSSFASSQATEMPMNLLRSASGSSSNADGGGDGHPRRRSRSQVDRIDEDQFRHSRSLSEVSLISSNGVPISRYLFREDIDDVSQGQGDSSDFEVVDDEDDMSWDAASLPRPTNDSATDVTPIPSSFFKLEESIAEQQALLRNMLLEGRRFRQQDQPQSLSQRSQQYVVEDRQYRQKPRPQFNLLPQSMSLTP